MVAPAFPISLLDLNRVGISESGRFATSTESSADDVLVRAQAGDPDAFSMLYFRHKKRVLSICMRMVHDFPLAEDLAQETFLQLHRKIASFRGDSAFTTWLHRMTVNVVLMQVRKHVLPVISLDQMMTDVPDGNVGRSFGTCDRRQTGVIDRVALDRAVASLPPGYRLFFLLHDVQGLEHREIAFMEGCSVGNSKSQVHKARRALRDALSAPTGRVLPD